MFGHLVNSDSFAVMDAIAALTVVDASSQFGTDFTNLPVVNYDGTSFTTNNFAEVSSVTVLPSHPAFFNGEVSAGNAVNYLTFSNGNFFGYYSYLTNADYIYHFDLGYEYVFDANDGHDGIYLYDFASNTFFYTSPTFSVSLPLRFHPERGALLFPRHDQRGALHDESALLRQSCHRGDPHEIGRLRFPHEVQQEFLALPPFTLKFVRVGCPLDEVQFAHAERYPGEWFGDEKAVPAFQAPSVGILERDR